MYGGGEGRAMARRPRGDGEAIRDCTENPEVEPSGKQKNNLLFIGMVLGKMQLYRERERGGGWGGGGRRLKTEEKRHQ